jgi:hypothetical protein
MSQSLLATAQARLRPLAPVSPRFALLFCVVLLASASALASLAFACATPFAAYAVVASAMLSLPAALVATVAAWAVNQAIGFGVLGYPHDALTVTWGLAIGVAALAATGAAVPILRSFKRASLAVTLAVALVAAFAAYELVLFAFTFVLGGAGAFAAPIVGRLAVLNALWLIGLVAVTAIVRLALQYRHRLALP